MVCKHKRLCNALNQEWTSRMDCSLHRQPILRCQHQRFRLVHLLSRTGCSDHAQLLSSCQWTRAWDRSLLRLGYMHAVGLGRGPLDKRSHPLTKYWTWGLDCVCHDHYVKSTMEIGDGGGSPHVHQTYSTPSLFVTRKCQEFSREYCCNSCLVMTTCDHKCCA